MKSNSNIHPVYKSRVKSLEETLTHIAGVPVEITIRAIDHYTFTFDGRNDKAGADSTIIVHSIPHITLYCPQYAFVTIFDPIMQSLEPFIPKKK